MDPTPCQVIVVEPAELRRLFETSGLWDAYRCGLLTEQVKRSRHVADRTHHCFCTFSEVVRLFEGDQKVAVVHRYRRADGSLAASGKLDPKMIRIGCTIFRTPD
jgi:hypothetical protein